MARSANRRKKTKSLTTKIRGKPLRTANTVAQPNERNDGRQFSKYKDQFGK
jgi:hypothetical protein